MAETSKPVLRLNREIWNLKSSHKSVTYIEDEKPVLRLSKHLWNGRNTTATQNHDSNSEVIRPIVTDRLDEKTEVKHTLNNFGSTRSIESWLLSERMCVDVQYLISSLPDNIRDKQLSLSQQEISLSAIGILTYSKLIKHMADLRVEKVQRIMRPLLQKLMQHPRNVNIFNQPVDPTHLKIPEYFAKIKVPMDLGTIKSKLLHGVYGSIESCSDDILLVFRNATTFNPPKHIIHQVAKAMEEDYENEIKAIQDKTSKEMERKFMHSCTLCQGALCPLCGEKCLKFEPPIINCNGQCFQRIKRNNVVFITPDGIRQWCQRCFTNLPAEIIEDGCEVVLKKDLLRRRFDEEVAEPWAQCDSCGKWVHQICALFNDRGNDSDIPYYCPLCQLEKGLGQEELEKLQQSIAVLETPAKSIMTSHSLPTTLTPTNKKKLVRPRTTTSPMTSSASHFKSPSMATTTTTNNLRNNHLSYALRAQTPTSFDLELRKRSRSLDADSLHSNSNSSSKKPPTYHSSSINISSNNNNKEALTAKTNSETSLWQTQKQHFTFTRRTSSVDCSTEPVPLLNRQRKLKFDLPDLDPTATAEVKNDTVMTLSDIEVVNPLVVSIPPPTSTTTSTSTGPSIIKLEDSSEPLTESIFPSQQQEVEQSQLPHHAMEIDGVSMTGGGGTSTNIISSTSTNNHILINLENENKDPTEMEIQHPNPSNNNTTNDNNNNNNDIVSINSCKIVYNINNNSENKEISNNKVFNFEDLDINNSSNNNGNNNNNNNNNSNYANVAELKSADEDIDLQTFANSANSTENMNVPNIIPEEDLKNTSTTSNKDSSSDSCCSSNIGSSNSKDQWKASSLPNSKLSLFLETLINERLRTLGFADTIGTLTVRLVSNSDHYMEVPECITSNLTVKDSRRVSKYLPYRQKCILLFQQIEGIDVCLFSLYVQEFDQSCPEPNKSKVYVAYLDSVEYFRPREARSAVYHELMIGYLKWCQMRGFSQAHIWACPPQRGDSFVFWCHPPHQRTPSRERLNAWYVAILHRASLLGILSEVETLWSEYFAIQYNRREEVAKRTAAKVSFVGSGSLNKSSSVSMNHHASPTASTSSSTSTATGEQMILCPPVFEGDFWVNEFLKIHRIVQARAKNGDGYDAVTNQRKCREMLKSLMTKAISAPFNHPVNPILLNIPLYFQVIQNPMDLGTIRDKLRGNKYATMLEFAQDVRLTFQNATTFNPPGHGVHTMATTLLTEFEKYIQDFIMERIDTAEVDILTINKLLGTYPTMITLTENSNKPKVNKQLIIKEKMEILNKDKGESTTDPMEPFDWSTGSTNMLLETNREDNNISPHYNSNNSNNNEKDDEPLFDEYPQQQISSSNIEVDIEDPTSSPSSDHLALKSNPSVTSLPDMNDNSNNNNNNNNNTTPMNIDNPNKNKNSVKNNRNSFERLVEDDDMTAGIDYSNPDHDVCSSDSSSSPNPSPSSPHSSNEKEYPTTISRTISRDSTNSEIPPSESWSSRPLTSFAHRLPDYGRVSSDMPCPVDELAGTKLEKTELGNRAVQSVMFELSKNINRIKDDLFVITFNTPSTTTIMTDSLGTTSKKQRLAEPTIHASNSNNSINSIDIPPSSKTSLKHKSKVAVLLRKSTNTQREELPEICNPLLQGIVPDTSDPDPVFRSPFIDSRHTFLEMCQYRHYQFDSLRRAKHSSLLLIYHLHHPFAVHLRPHCSVCKAVIKDIRWHCDLCSNSCDLCSSCAKSPSSHSHSPALVPMRVTFL